MTMPRKQAAKRWSALSDIKTGDNGARLWRPRGNQHFPSPSVRAEHGSWKRSPWKGFKKPCFYKNGDLLVYEKHWKTAWTLRKSYSYQSSAHVWAGLRFKGRFSCTVLPRYNAVHLSWPRRFSLFWGFFVQFCFFNYFYYSACVLSPDWL